MSIQTILVEDSKTIREVLIPTMAELADMDVMAWAETSSDAIETLGTLQEKWQLAVVDLFLKAGSGLDVLRAIKDRPRVKLVVVLSNYATADMRKTCLELGADAVFDKSTQLDMFFEFCVAQFAEQDLRSKQVPN